MFQPENSGGRHIELFATDPETGRQVRWQLDKQPGTIKEISQIVVLDARDEVVADIAIPTAMTTGAELLKLLSEHGIRFIEKAQVIAASDDYARIERLFSEIGKDVRLQPQAGGLIAGPSIFKVETNLAYFRAIAKIGFHYALKYVPTVFGSESEFAPLRAFIRDGSGDAGTFVSQCDPITSYSEPAGHFIAVLAQSQSPVVVCMQFFTGCDNILPQWRVNLGLNPTVLHLDQRSGHFFAYSVDEDGRLKGDEVLALRVGLSG